MSRPALFVLLASCAIAPPLRADGPVQPRAVRAIDRALVVRFDGPCLDASTVAGRVSHFLERTTMDAALSIVVEGRARPEKAVSFVLLSEGRFVAVRRFEALAGGCAELLDALSLSIALAIDAAERGETPPAAEVASAPPAAPRAEILAGGWASLAVLPSAAAGVELAARRSVRPRWLVGVGLLGTFPVDVAVGAGQARVFLLGGRAEGCVRARPRAVRPLACLGVAAGPVLSRARGFDEPRSGAALWAAAEARGALEVGVSRHVSLFVAASALAPLVRPVLDARVSTGAVVARRPFPAVGAALSGGVVVTLP